MTTCITHYAVVNRIPLPETRWERWKCSILGTDLKPLVENVSGVLSAAARNPSVSYCEVTAAFSIR